MRCNVNKFRRIDGIKYIGTLRTAIDGCLADITDSSTLDHVPHGESLDSLVLSNTARAVRATDEGDVATALLVASIRPPFLSLESKTKFQQGPFTSAEPVQSSSSAKRIQNHELPSSLCDHRYTSLHLHITLDNG